MMEIFAALDTETSGLDPAFCVVMGDRVTQGTLYHLSENRCGYRVFNSFAVHPWLSPE